MSGPTANSLCRINYLKDPATLDKLLDAFENDGMPMGSDRWAEHCFYRFKELREKEDQLRILEHNISKLMKDTCLSRSAESVWLILRKNLTKEFQEQKAIEDLKVMP